MFLAFSEGSAYIECMSSTGLSASDREFFSGLADVVYGNQYSAQRLQVAARLAPGALVDDFTLTPNPLAQAVEARLAPLLVEGRARLERLGAEDRRLLEPAFLYVCYHRFVPQLDALIERQLKQSGAPVNVPFGDDAIGELVRNGFSEERAVRYFAFIFHLRRAFYFIHGSLAGESESMRRLREALWNNVVTHDMRGYETALWNRMEDFSTLLLGETGTGKGSAAAAIGRAGFIPYVPAEQRFAASFADAFIAINLSQFSEALIESELFGHVKGAFTGAIGNHEGIFQRCNAHGALFLDEIGEVSVPVQIKLLQVLQDRVFTPVGGHERKRFSGRVIAATNRPLGALRREGRFRDDFFYRLCSDVIEVPTLRRRIVEAPGELEQMARLLVARIAGSEDRALADSVVEALEASVPASYTWPGNVRELEQAVRRILLTGRYAGDLVEATQSGDDALLAKLRSGDLSAVQLLEQYCALLYRRYGTYTEVAKRTGLDPRTSRKHVENAKSG
jgi:two-component system, NtrC family, response regulator HydG